MFPPADSNNTERTMYHIEGSIWYLLLCNHGKHGKAKLST